MYSVSVNPLSWWNKFVIAAGRVLSPPAPADVQELLSKEQELMAEPDSAEKFMKLSRVYKELSEAYSARTDFDYKSQVRSYYRLSEASRAKSLGITKSNAILDL